VAAVRRRRGPLSLGSERANAAKRRDSLKADIDYPVLQRILLEPASHLPYLADAFATLCEKSIAAIVTLDECMAGLELAVATAEGSSDPGTRRWIAERCSAGCEPLRRGAASIGRATN